MPPRASWTGHLKLSFVSIPVRLYNAISSTSRVALNQLHRDCNNRIKNKTVCPEHGEVQRADIVKGYEVEKGKYVVVDESDLEKVKLESNKTIEIMQFVDQDEVDPMILNAPYYVAPDGAVAQTAFAVIREAMGASGKVAIGRVVMSNKEHIVALAVEDKGFVMTTLRYADEVRKPDAYFEDIADEKVDKEQLKLARQLIESKAAAFDHSEWKDRYKDALLEVIKAKLEGKEPAVVQTAEAGKVINLMDALRESVAAQTRKKPPAKSVRTTAAKKKKKKKA